MFCTLDTGIPENFPDTFTLGFCVLAFLHLSPHSVLVAGLPDIPSLFPLSVGTPKLPGPTKYFHGGSSHPRHTCPVIHWQSTEKLDTLVVVIKRIGQLHWIYNRKAHTTCFRIWNMKPQEIIHQVNIQADGNILSS